MATVRAIPKIVLDINGLTDPTIAAMERQLFDGAAPWTHRKRGGGGMLLDVDVAERAVAWLKAHGVEQESKAPERDSDPIHVTIARQQAKSALDLFDNIDMDGLREEVRALLDELCAAIRASLGR